MKKQKHIFRKVLLVILGLIAGFLLFSFIRHSVLLEGEKDLLTPPGQMVDVDGSNDLWKKVAYDYAEDLNSISFVELDCGHYIFHYEPEKITEEINAFLQNLDH